MRCCGILFFVWNISHTDPNKELCCEWAGFYRDDDELWILESFSEDFF